MTGSRAAGEGTTPRTWTLRHDERPWTVNKERGMPWRQHGALTKSWRYAFFLLAKQARIPKLQRVVLEVVAIKPNRRAIPDPGGVLPGAKAAIDGLVDAGVIADDTDLYVRALTFLPHRIEAGCDALELTVREVA